MFAGIKTGGKQYRVTPDDVIQIERISGEAGDEVFFNDVLILADDGKTAVGTPLVDGARVTGTLMEQTRGEKIIIFKKKRRKSYRRRNGHRQQFTELQIDDIIGLRAKKKAAPKKAKTKKKAADAAPEATAKGSES